MTARSAIALFAALTTTQLCASAFAQGADPAKKAAPASKPAAPLVRPKPDAALAAYKPWQGTWKCSGKAVDGGVEHAMTGTVKFEWSLDGQWLQRTIDAGDYHSRSYYGYKPATKLYTSFNVDNAGNYIHRTSPGPDKDGLWKWAGKGSAMDKLVDLSDTVEGKDGKSIHVSGSDTAGSTYDAVCKR
jgi:hypothetical protein